MGFSIVQAGTALQVLEDDGSIYQTITLPSGVTIDATRKARFVVLDRKIVVTNAPSVNLWIDPLTFTARVLAIQPPLAAPGVATGGAGDLTGDYLVAYAFGQKASDGTVLNLSPLSPTSAAVSLTSNALTASGLEVSTDAAVTFRRLYRTAAGGTVLFPWVDLDDNFTTSYTGDETDEELGVVPADDELGLAPGGSVAGSYLTAAVEWKHSIWGVSSDAALRDQVNYCAPDKIYGWPSAYNIPANPKGEDVFGVVGLIPRRDALGIGKRGRLLKIIGDDATNYRVLVVHEKIGVVSLDSIVVIHDIAYFLGQDGVYRWDDAQVTNITDGQVEPWFKTGTYFDRAYFPQAVGSWNPDTKCYELCLVPAGGSTLTRWVAFDIDTQRWLGIHRTGAFTPVSRGLFKTDGAELLPVVGGADGYIYLQNQAGDRDVAGDGTPAAINSVLTPGWIAGKDPDSTHFFGRLSVLGRIETAGKTMTVTPRVGNLNAGAQSPITIDLTLDRQILRRIGVGRLCRLTFEANTAGTGWLLYGFQFDDFFNVGTR